MTKMRRICCYVFAKREEIIRYQRHAEASELLNYIDQSLELLQENHARIIRQLFIRKEGHIDGSENMSIATNYRIQKRAIEEFVNCLNKQIVI